MRTYFCMACINHQLFKIWIVYERFEQFFLNAFVFSLAEATMSIFLVNIIWWQIFPWGNFGTQDPKYAVYKQAIVSVDSIPRVWPSWKQRPKESSETSWQRCAGIFIHLSLTRKTFVMDFTPEKLWFCVTYTFKTRRYEIFCVLQRWTFSSYLATMMANFHWSC